MPYRLSVQEEDGQILHYSDSDFSSTAANEKDKMFDENYSTIKSYSETLRGHDAGLNERQVGKTSSFFASYNVICTVVGTGLLQLPYGVNESGWIGVFMLLFMCCIATYTAIILIQCMNPPSGRKLYSYAEIGEEAFGKPGRIIVELMLHATLIGVATIYLILASQNVVTLLQNFPSTTGVNGSRDLLPTLTSSDSNLYTQLCIIAVAAVVWLHVWLGTLHEVGFMSAFNVLVAVFLFLVVVVEIVINMPTTKASHEFLNTGYDGLMLAGAFVSFAFSYGAHAILPTVYETMKKPKQFNIMISTTFVAILFFYIPMASIGYYAYGTGTVSPIYDNLCSVSDGTCSFGQQLGKWLAIFAVTLHVILSYAIVLNPTEIALERICKISKLRQPVRKLAGVGLRTILVLVTVTFAFIIPDFGDVLNLVSSLTNTATTFVFPCLFHMRLFWPKVKKNPLVVSIDVGIIILTTVAGAFGAFFAVMGILCHVFGISVDPNESCSTS